MPWWRALSTAASADPRVRALARELRGDVVGRDDTGYDVARLLTSTRFDSIKPLAVAYCETADDVARCVRWSQRHGLPLRARSGGHSYGGWSTVQGGLVVDVGRLGAVTVDAPAKTARIGAGTRLIDVYEALWRAGDTIPAGSCPTVGIAGLALGGGIGFSARAARADLRQHARGSRSSTHGVSFSSATRRITPISTGPAAAAAGVTSASPRPSASASIRPGA